MNSKLGLDNVFLEFDNTKRQGYEQRAQAAQGVVEGSGPGQTSRHDLMSFV